jgi:hypothetical protein
MTAYPSTGARPTLVISGTAEPVAASPQAEAFYGEVLRELARSGLPVLLAGTYAVSVYTGISRRTKDLDIFCRAGDFPRILAHFKERGYAIEIEDERWIAKVRKGEQFFDLIFASANGTHDYESNQADEVAHILKSAGMQVLDGQSYEVDGVGFVGARSDSRGPAAMA